MTKDGALNTNLDGPSPNDAKVLKQKEEEKK